MKKQCLLLIIISFLSIEIKAQKCDIQFSKFRLEWFNIMGFRGGGNGQRLKLTFRNISGNTLKYVTVHYWAINAVNDIETDQFNRKDFSVNCTGPFMPGKQNKLEVEIALFHPNLLRSYPYKLDITYMDGEEKEIDVNQNNISSIFPCLTPIDVGNIESAISNDTIK